MTQYQVVYDAPEGLCTYCVCDMDYATAQRMLALFMRKYIAPDGTGKPYPNGKGFYDVRNPRIVEVA